MRRIVPLALLLLLPPPAFADERVQARLLPGWQEPDGRRVAGLRLELAPGWKTYWRAPGEAGIPPRFDWSGSVNVASVEVRYPAPEVLDPDGLQSLGYHDAVTFPLVVLPRDPARPVQLSGRVDIGVCDDICVPVAFDVAATMAPGEAADGETVRRALAAEPVAAAAAGAGALTCRSEPLADGIRLTVSAEVPALGGDEAMAVETSDPGIWVGDARTWREGGRLSARAELVPVAAAPFALERQGVRVTAIGRDGAIEWRGCTAG